jgi:hypothetical protein
VDRLNLHECSVDENKEINKLFGPFLPILLLMFGLLMLSGGSFMYLSNSVQTSKKKMLKKVYAHCRSFCKNNLYYLHFSGPKVKSQVRSTVKKLEQQSQEREFIKMSLDPMRYAYNVGDELNKSIQRSLSTKPGL